MTLDKQAQDWLAQHTGIASDEMRLERLPGANSSVVLAVTDATRLAAPRFVLRVVSDAAWIAEAPDLAEHEAAALREAAQAGLRAPCIIAHAGAETGFAGPAVLMSFLDGEVQIHPRDRAGWIRALAAGLAAIHRHQAPAFPWQFESWVNWDALAVPDWTAVPEVWEEAIAIAGGPVPQCPEVFLHRDYHPVNVLWRGEEISGVVDWINACRGPAGVDVAHCRCNLALMYGIAEADAFLDAYCSMAREFVHERYWDIDCVFSMFLPEPEWYRPWAELGMDVLRPAVMHGRVDAFLRGVVGRGACVKS